MIWYLTDVIDKKIQDAFMGNNTIGEGKTGSNDLLVCPVCGGDRKKDLADVIKLCIEKGLTGESCNPGGRELRFGNKRLQIGDMCNACDEKKIRKFLAI